MKRLSIFSAGLLICFLAHLGAEASTFIGQRTDFRDETIYFAMTTRFYDGDPDNNVYCWDGLKNVNDPEWRGDFKGLIDKLDYIKALGFTAIWITPIVENGSGLDYHGYHALDFSKVDHRYVSSDADADGADIAFKTLIEEVHKRDMKLILDIVLQHTGNFGEATLCPMFCKDYSKNLALADESMIPLTVKDGGRLPDNYSSLPGKQQYDTRLALMKNTDFINHDTSNHYHHKAWFDWDDPSRWWGQIAGDCVDLNTENPTVADYLVDCYSRFIKMGVDGFRIDTAGHIPRLSLNNLFIPRFLEAADSQEAISNRGNTPFFIYGEVCARSMEVIYRGDNYNCSPCYYTWKESRDYPWDYDAESWDSVVAIPTATEGSQDFQTVSGHTNWDSVLQSARDDKGHSDAILRRSDNHKLIGNDYHAPDLTQHSGLNVIDFAMHWNFNSAQGAYGVRTQDWLYNDATYNVVYVDSHDYAPDSNYRFNKDQSTWAENLSLMFTFRGIPCLYYGSEVEFQKGKDIDKGPDLPLRETGRAYFGGFIEGDVVVKDFGEYENATGNMASTLSYPLAKHIQRLNKIRAAVPALRKGQYSNDGCSGKMAFKRRYTDDTTDSYALVTISGDATFTGILNGTYSEVITGETVEVTDGRLSVSCKGKGNVRVFVLSTEKTPAPGKVGEDGKYLYGVSPVEDSWAYWPDETMPEDTWTVRPQGGGGSDITEPENPIEPALSPGEQSVFFENTGDWNPYFYCYVWDGSNQILGLWPGKSMEYLGRGKYKFTYDGTDIIPSTAGVIFSSDRQTADLQWVNGGYYTADGLQRVIEPSGEGLPRVVFNPAGGVFEGVIDVSISREFADEAFILIGDSAPIEIKDEPSVIRLGEDMEEGESIKINWTASNASQTREGSVVYTKRKKPVEMTVYYDDSLTLWETVRVHYWGGERSSSWPGDLMEKIGEHLYRYSLPGGTTGVVFNNGRGDQTNDVNPVVENHLYRGLGNRGFEDCGIYVDSGIVATESDDITVYYNMQGIPVAHPTKGVYIMRQGTKTKKVVIY